MSREGASIDAKRGISLSGIVCALLVALATVPVHVMHALSHSPLKTDRSGLDRIECGTTEEEVIAIVRGAPGDQTTRGVPTYAAHHFGARCMWPDDAPCRRKHRQFNCEVIAVCFKDGKLDCVVHQVGFAEATWFEKPSNCLRQRVRIPPPELFEPYD